jgi:hypothetical protein
VPLRMYVPYGHATLPYRVLDARRDARVLGWLAQDLLRGRRKGWRGLSGRRGPQAPPRDARPAPQAEPREADEPPPVAVP